MEQNPLNNQKPKSRKTTILLGIGLGALALGGFGYWFFKGRKGTEVDPGTDLFHKVANDEVTNDTSAAPSNKGNGTKPVNSGFPLKRNSKGELVKQLQQALINTYGKAILPKYGVDGDFGTEVITALASKGYPETIDLTDFTKIISGKATTPSAVTTPAAPPPSAPPIAPLNTVVSKAAATDIAKHIWIYATSQQLNALLDTLSKIKNVADYAVVNEVFKTLIVKGVHQTIVNGVLNCFVVDEDRVAIKDALRMIGLKESNGKWSLSGLAHRRIITRIPTTIRHVNGLIMEVPEQTILGVELGRVGNMTSFRTLDNNILYVPSNHINYV